MLPGLGTTELDSDETTSPIPRDDQSFESTPTPPKDPSHRDNIEIAEKDEIAEKNGIPEIAEKDGIPEIAEKDTVRSRIHWLSMRSFWVPLQAFKVFHIIGMFNGMISTFRGWRLGVLNPIIHAILKFNEHHCRSRRVLANKNTCTYTIRNPKCCENNTTRTGSQDLHVCVCV